MQQTRIICVDDERNVLRALERIFMDFDYEILTASSGEEGLELLNSVPQVQVVISDYRMPGMNGVEFLKEVFRRHPQSIRIVLSGYADTAAVVAAINEGKIYKFIPKPWNDDELRVTVAKALETFAIQRKNEQLAEELRLKNAELCELNANLERLLQEASCRLHVRHCPRARAALILEELPVGVLVLSAAGVVLQAAGKAGSLLGLPAAELAGKSALELLPRGLWPAQLTGLAAERMVEVNGMLVRVQEKGLPLEGVPAALLTLFRESRHEEGKS